MLLADTHSTKSKGQHEKFTVEEGGLTIPQHTTLHHTKPSVPRGSDDNYGFGNSQ